MNIINQMDEEDYNEFIKLIKDTIIAECKYNIEKTAKVTVINGSLFDVQLIGETTSITGLKNRSGETISVGDAVRLEIPNSNDNHIYIKYKL